MKTEDAIQLGALALVGYLAYQKFGAAQGKVPVSTGPGSGSIQPSQQPPDFGVNNPSDTDWGDTVSPGYLQQVIDWAF